MSPVHQVWPKPSCREQLKGEEDKSDRKRGGKITSGNGRAWSSPSPRGQWKMEKNGCEVTCGAAMTLVIKGVHYRIGEGLTLVACGLDCVLICCDHPESFK